MSKKVQIFNKTLTSFATCARFAEARAYVIAHVPIVAYPARAGSQFLVTRSATAWTAHSGTAIPPVTRLAGVTPIVSTVMTGSTVGPTWTAPR